MGDERTATRGRPGGVRRRSVMAATTLTLLVLAGVFAFAEQLRHPLPGEEELPEVEVTDPREEIVCPDWEGDTAPPSDEPIEVTSDDLVDCPRSYHGRTVSYGGEVVGEVLERSGFAWAHVNDDVYAGVDVAATAARGAYAGDNAGVGVQISSELAGRITHTGGPGRRGDTVAVEGRFYRALAGSGEPMAIVAERGSVTDRGGPMDDPVLPDRRIAAGVLAVLAAAMVGAERLISRRR